MRDLKEILERSSRYVERCSKVTLSPSLVIFHGFPNEHPTVDPPMGPRWSSLHESVRAASQETPMRSPPWAHAYFPVGCPSRDEEIAIGIEIIDERRDGEIER